MRKFKKSIVGIKWKKKKKKRNDRRRWKIELRRQYWRRWKVEQSKNCKKHKIIKDAKDVVQNFFCKHSLHASKNKNKKAICYIRS